MKTDLKAGFAGLEVRKKWWGIFFVILEMREMKAYLEAGFSRFYDERLEEGGFESWWRRRGGVSGGERDFSGGDDLLLLI